MESLREVGNREKERVEVNNLSENRRKVKITLSQKRLLSFLIKDLYA